MSLRSYIKHGSKRRNKSKQALSSGCKRNLFEVYVLHHSTQAVTAVTLIWFGTVFRNSSCQCSLFRRLLLNSIYVGQLSLMSPIWWRYGLSLWSSKVLWHRNVAAADSAATSWYVHWPTNTSEGNPLRCWECNPCSRVRAWQCSTIQTQTLQQWNIDKIHCLALSDV